MDVEKYINKDENLLYTINNVNSIPKITGLNEYNFSKFVILFILFC